MNNEYDIDILGDILCKNKRCGDVCGRINTDISVPSDRELYKYCQTDGSCTTKRATCPGK